MSDARPFAKLRRADLEQAPIWEWQSDGSESSADAPASDESFVRPTAHRRVPVTGFAQWLVAGTIVLADGSEMPGIVEVTVHEGAIACEATTVFLLERKLTFPARETNRLLARYTKSPQAHPVAWRLSVPLEGEEAPRQGTLEGTDLKDLTQVAMDVLLALKQLRK